MEYRFNANPLANPRSAEQGLRSPPRIYAPSTEVGKSGSARNVCDDVRGLGSEGLSVLADLLHHCPVVGATQTLHVSQSLPVPLLERDLRGLLQQAVTRHTNVAVREAWADPSGNQGRPERQHNCDK